LIAMGAVGIKRPRSRASASRDAKDSRGKGSACPVAIRRSVRECREALGPLVSHIEPKTRWDVYAVKIAE